MFVVAGWVFNISALDSWAAWPWSAMIHDSVSENKTTTGVLLSATGLHKC